jgi:cytochrome P450
MHSSQLVVDFQHYFAQKIEDRQRQPTDDVLSEIVNSTADGERPMNIPECLSVIAQLLVAGNETTTATFAEGMSLLINNPDQLKKVQKNRKLIPNMVEEMLRLATPSAQMWRIVTQDTNIGGVDIPKGSTVMIKWISANRDEQFYPDGHRFDVERHNSRRHLAFGQGIHHCPGAPLARLELEIGWEVILDRMTNFSTDTELEFHPSLLLHAPVGIHIKFNKT